MAIEEYLGDWLKVIDRKILDSTLNKVMSEYKKKSVYPSPSNVFKAFKLCPLDKLKIVMLGYDPYPQKDVATGILFGNSRDTPESKLSPSLEIIKEAVIDYRIPHDRLLFDQTLESWSRQGVLMLNSALTVEANKTGSHTMIWRSFIADLLTRLSEYDTAIVYVLFGSQAKTFKPYINDRSNYVIEERHPAYYARTHTKMPNELFVDINDIVRKIHNIPIKWYDNY